MNLHSPPAQTELDWMMKLEQDGSFLQYIENPTPLMLLTAITRTPEAIRYIENPTLTHWNMAITKNPALFRDAKETLTTDLFFELLNSIPDGLKQLEDSEQNYRMCRQLIRLNQRNKTYSVYHQDS